MEPVSQSSVGYFLNTSQTMNKSGGPIDRSPVIMAGYAELMGSIIGVPANLLVLYLWATMGRKGANRYDATDTRVHNNNRWFILGMTLADLIFTAIHSPMGAAWFIWYQDYIPSLCALFLFCTHASTTSSSINILLLNIDKFIYLYKPLRYPNIVTKNRAIVCLIFGWIIALSWATLFTFGPWLVIAKKCSGVKLESSMEYLYFVIFFFFLPITASFLISCYIAYITIRASHDNMVLVYGMSSQDSTETTISKFSYLSTRLKTIAFIFTATMWSTVTCIPYRIAYILHQMGIKDRRDYLWGFYSLYIMMVMTALGNPFITIFTQPNYRKGLKAELSRRRNTETDSRSTSYVGMKPSSSIESKKDKSGLVVTYHANRNSNE